MTMGTKMNNTRYTGVISHEECTTDLLVNPFVHKLELETTYEKIKVGFKSEFVGEFF